MTTASAANWFNTQSNATLTNPLSRSALVELLNDPVNALTLVTLYRRMRLTNALDTALFQTVTTEFTELLARLPVNWQSALERTFLAQAVASLSILPFSKDFSTLGDGTLPSQFTGATWTIASGKALNTPTEGSEKLTDGGFETWSSATDLTNWTETLAGTSTVNRDGVEQRSGTFCARQDIDASNSNAIISQAPTVAVNDWCILRGYAKSIPAGKQLFFKFNNQLAQQVTQPALTTSYQLLVQNSVISTLSGFSVQANKVAATSSSLYLDDFSLKKLTTATLYAVIDPGVANVITKANWTITFGSLAGVIMNLDSTSSPLNWVALLSSGSTNNIYLWKCVNGTITQVMTSAITYVANAAVELRKTASTTYQVWYNGAQIGSNQTISDAGIIDNTKHGLLSAYSGSLCSFFSAA